MRIIKMSELYGAARDFGGDGLSFDNYDKMPEPFLDDIIEASAPVEPPELPKEETLNGASKFELRPLRKPLASGGKLKRS